MQEMQHTLGPVSPAGNVMVVVGRSSLSASSVESVTVTSRSDGASSITGIWTSKRMSNTV